MAYAMMFQIYGNIYIKNTTYKYASSVPPLSFFLPLVPASGGDSSLCKKIINKY